MVCEGRAATVLEVRKSFLLQREKKSAAGIEAVESRNQLPPHSADKFMSFDCWALVSSVC